MRGDTERQTDIMLAVTPGSIPMPQDSPIGSADAAEGRPAWACHEYGQRW